LKTIQRGGGLRPPPLWVVWKPPGPAQIPKTTDFQPNPKPSSAKPPSGTTRKQCRATLNVTSVLLSKGMGTTAKRHTASRTKDVCTRRRTFVLQAGHTCKPCQGSQSKLRAPRSVLAPAVYSPLRCMPLTILRALSCLASLLAFCRSLPRRH